MRPTLMVSSLFAALLLGASPGGVTPSPTGVMKVTGSSPVVVSGTAAQPVVGMRVCAAGEVLKAISDGGWACGPAAPQLPACTSGQFLTSDGGFICATPSAPAYPNCPVGYFVSADGGGLICNPELDPTTNVLAKSTLTCPYGGSPTWGDGGWFCAMGGGIWTQALSNDAGFPINYPIGPISVGTTSDNATITARHDRNATSYSILSLENMGAGDLTGASIDFSVAPYNASPYPNPTAKITASNVNSSAPVTHYGYYTDYTSNIARIGFLGGQESTLSFTGTNFFACAIGNVSWYAWVALFNGAGFRVEWAGPTHGDEIKAYFLDTVAGTVSLSATAIGTGVHSVCIGENATHYRLKVDNRAIQQVAKTGTRNTSYPPDIAIVKGSYTVSTWYELYAASDDGTDSNMASAWNGMAANSGIRVIPDTAGVTLHCAAGSAGAYKWNCDSATPVSYFSLDVIGTMTSGTYPVSPSGNDKTDLLFNVYTGTTMTEAMRIKYSGLVLLNYGVTFPDGTTQYTAVPSGTANSQVPTWNGDAGMWTPGPVVYTESDPFVYDLGKTYLLPTNGQVPTWNADAGVWVAATRLVTETDPTVNSLGKTSLTPANSQVPTWNGDAGVWTTLDPSGIVITETDPTVNVLAKSVGPNACGQGQSPVQGDGGWSCQTALIVEFDPSVFDLGKTYLAPTNGQVPVWNGDASVWTTGTPSVASNPTYPACTAGQFLTSDGGLICESLPAETDPTVNALAKASLAPTNGQAALYNGDAGAWTTGLVLFSETDPSVNALGKATLTASHGNTVVYNADAGVWKTQTVTSVDETGGYMGIGTSTPAYRLDILGNSTNSQVLRLRNQTVNTTFWYVNAGTGTRSIFEASQSRGTLSSPTTVVDGDQLFSVVADGHDGTDFRSKASMEFLVDGAVSTNVVPTAMSFWTSDTSATRTEKMRITSSGNVGLGTTATDPGSLGANYRQLTIKGPSTGAGSSYLNLQKYTATSSTDIGGVYFHNGATPVALMAVNGSTATDDGRFIFYTRPTGGSLTGRMYIESTGKIGIGLDTPSVKLDVYESTDASVYEQIKASSATKESGIIVRNSANKYIDMIACGASAPGYIWGDSSVVRANAVGFEMNSTAINFFRGIDNVPMVFGTNNLERLRIMADGNVGIGTDNPDPAGWGSGYRILAVKGPSTGEGLPIIVFQNYAATTNSGVGQFSFFNGTTNVAMFAANGDGATDSGRMIFYTKPTGGSITGRMFINSTGDVGVGTATPDVGSYGADYRQFTIKGPSTGVGIPMINFQNYTASVSGSTGLVNFFNGTTRVATVSSRGGGATDSGEISFDTKPTGGSLATRMSIKSDGKVGIGTTGPNAPLNIVVSSGTEALTLSRYSTDATGTVERQQKARGTESVPASVVDGDVLGRWNFGGYSTNQFMNGAEVRGVVTGTPSSTALPSSLLFYTALDNTSGIIERMRIAADGKVGIGTAGPASQLLTVAGIIESTTGGFKFPNATTQVTAVPSGSANGQVPTWNGDAGTWAPAAEADPTVNSLGKASLSPTNGQSVSWNGDAGVWAPISGATTTVTVKGSDGNNCDMVYLNGLLASTTCP